MSISAFDGAAGCGKTYSAIEQLRAELIANPLQNSQRVLARTYMHGARIRLDDQLEQLPELKGRYEASTLDSLAWRICRRWRSRIRQSGYSTPPADDYDANCELAAKLLAANDVRMWVASAYPVILIDEAQDLEVGRLSIVDELLKSCCVLLAFDEFQCLNARNRPVAVTTWIKAKCNAVTLEGNKRTTESHLLSAARQIRGSEPITANGRSFRIVVAPSNSKVGPVLAAATIGYEMLKGGTFVILTPSKDAPYAKDIVGLLQAKPVGKNKIGPFSIRWEGAGDDRVGDARKLILNSETYAFLEADALLTAFPEIPSAVMTLATLRRMRDARGVEAFSRAALIEVFDRHISSARQFTRRRSGGRLAMTIHQAKNREFDRVAVIWPYKIPPSADDRRRLLYNAVTRARMSCVVVVQNASLMGQAPFA
jgi:superfamily I DNA/RNA helicase